MSLRAVLDLATGQSEPVDLPLVISNGRAALIVLAESLECPQCHRAVRIASNRNGRTLCLFCDDEAVLQTSAPIP